MGESRLCCALTGIPVGAQTKIKIIPLYSDPYKSMVENYQFGRRWSLYSTVMDGVTGCCGEIDLIENSLSKDSFFNLFKSETINNNYLDSNKNVNEHSLLQAFRNSAIPIKLGSYSDAKGKDVFLHLAVISLDAWNEFLKIPIEDGGFYDSEKEEYTKKYTNFEEINEAAFKLVSSQIKKRRYEENYQFDNFHSEFDENNKFYQMIAGWRIDSFNQQLILTSLNHRRDVDQTLFVDYILDTVETVYVQEVLFDFSQVWQQREVLGEADAGDAPEKIKKYCEMQLKLLNNKVVL